MSDFPEKSEDNVNGMAIVVIGLATTAILWASVIALQAYFENTEGEIAQQRAIVGRADGVRGLKSKQTNVLHQTTYADPNKGTLKRLSIEHAKSAVLRDAKAGASTLIPTLGLLDKPSVPATAGKPALVPADGAASPPADPAAPAEAAPGATLPAEAAPAAPTPAAAPTGTTP